ncbi:MAG: hypothetical protein C4562_03745 [Actinobacteria bacterium]|nr:MAG: hypothetical protein C4562_03745 [Actinomycetota bacterium]
MMSSRQLILAIPSLIAFILATWHMVVYRGKKTAVYFISIGFAFGLIRAKIIYFVQIVFNKSLIPYQFQKTALKIGNDSLQVYLGWILAAYLAWCFGEIILKNLGRLTGKDNSQKIFPIIAIAFLAMTAISYATEATASYMRWWSWNPFLETGSLKSLFVSVPWVGIVDWGSVAFEFLGSFFLIRYAFINKKWSYLGILALPLLHWASHINTTFNLHLLGQLFTPSLIWHYLMFVLPIILFVIKSPSLDEGLKLNQEAMSKIKPQALVFASLGIILAINLLCDLLIGKKAIFILSLIPLVIIILISFLDIEYILATASIAIIFTFFIPMDQLTKQRIAMSFMPLAYLTVYRLTIDKKDFASLAKYRKQLIATILIIFSFATILVASQNQKMNTVLPSKSKRKIILVTIDTVSANHLGLYGYKRKTSPNIDNFAKDCTVFKNAYSPIPYTVPAHLSIMTGLYPKNLGIVQNAARNIKVKGKKLAELFKENGYATAGFVGFDLLRMSAFKKGFNILNFKPSANQSPIRQVAGKPKIMPRKTRFASDTNNEVFRWLDENASKDLFLWIHYYEPHSPYDAKRFKGTFSQNLKPTNPDYQDAFTSLFSSFDKQSTKEDVDFLEARYDEEILSLDSYFGELLAKLKQSSIYNDATIILAGDHGENFDHNRLFHGTNVYQNAVKVPLMIKSNFANKPETIKQNVSIIDIYPTLAKLFNLRISHDINGLDLFEASKTRDLFFETKYNTAIASKKFHRNKAVINDNNKLILSDNYNNQELYNISSDKEESKNLARKNKEETDNLLQKIKAFFPFEKSELSPGLLH